MFKIAGALQSGSEKNLTQVDAVSGFARTISELFAARRPRGIVETGTHLGLGTTTAIATAIREHGLTSEFYSIEVNPKYFRAAQKNVRPLKVPIQLLNGLSIPRSLLMSKQEIKQTYVETDSADDVFVDHSPQDRADYYFAETDFDALPDDLLRDCFGKLGGKPDFLLLDSAGHLGFVEFQYVLTMLTAPCVLALDDTRHVKHFKSVQAIKADRRFTVLTESTEKFGYCFAEFNP